MDFRSLMPFGRRDITSGEDAFTAMRREMDRLFDEMTRGMGLTRLTPAEGMMTPRVDVRETDQAVEVCADLPGVDEKDLDLQFADNVLTIRGEKRREAERREEGYHLVERSYGRFFRRVPLPVEVEVDKAEARFERGVLTVTLPKSATAERRAHRIEVKTG